jgi:glycosyltransferase involved in cell wall biosynthesis
LAGTTKKHIIITKLFDSGGSNAHFKNLVKYLGAQNVILILESEDQLAYLNDLSVGRLHKVKIAPWLHGYVDLNHLFTSNIKEALLILRSLLTMLFMSIRHGLANVTISAVEAERHLYLFLLPLVKVTYILHTQPISAMTPYTPATCNKRLGKKRQIITVSRSMKQIIKQNWHISKAKEKHIHVVYNCIDESGFQHDASGNFAAGKRLITTMGHADSRKNPQMWLNVARSVTSTFPNVQFAWLGNGPLLSQFQQEVKDTPAIHFNGLTNNTGEYLANSTLYYQPSINEPHGIAVLEAMYHSLPCVVSNVGGLPESVLDNYNGIVVDPNNIDEHIKAITSLLNDDDMCSTFGKNAYSRYTENFSYKSFKTSMDAVYHPAK